MKRLDFPFLGFGVGLRRQHYTHVLENHPAMDWFEVISENFMVAGGRPLKVLERARENYPVVLHGVSMSIGSTDRPNRDYLRNLKRLIKKCEPIWVSDHLCWTGVGGHNTHDLLPLPYTDPVVRHVARRVREVQEVIERPILLENVSSYMTFKDSRLTEWQFLRAVAERPTVQSCWTSTTFTSTPSTIASTPTNTLTRSRSSAWHNSTWRDTATTAPTSWTLTTTRSARRSGRFMNMRSADSGQCPP